MNPVSNDFSSTIDQLGLGAAPAGPKKKEPLGQDAFLTLMITQMKNQNPLEPMKNQEFVAQLSQFTTASGVQDLKKSFDSLGTALQSNQALQASSLVGRNVLINSDKGFLPANGSMQGVVDVPDAVGNLHVNIYDSTGAIVRSVDLGQHSAGQVAYAWDGTDNAGKAVASGIYRVGAEAKFNGKTYNFDTLAVAPVKSVTIGRNGEGMMLNVGALGSVDLSDIRQIF